MVMYSREELEKMKMADLQKVGRESGAKDTDKKELVNEILSKQAGSGNTNDLIKEIEARKGDLVRTYDLRDRILERLNVLKSLEGG
jgi:hypothetical protein